MSIKKSEAINFYGGSVKLSKALNLSPAAVSQWGETVPLLRAYELERITGGKLKVDTTPHSEFKKAS